ncbi:MAG: glycosyltransferase family 2 protein [Bacteroidetes bacterium]|nr:glycosyltransferase family 2 protein [Bacteroidota bacterium]
MVTPIYNEEEIVVQATQQNLDALNQLQCNYEIIVVNDGSTDKSRGLLEKHFAHFEKIKIIHHSKNEGFGRAVMSGIEHASKDYVLCIPSDNPLNTSILNKFSSVTKEADVIVGYRYGRKGYTPMMRLNALVFHILVSTLFQIQLRDFNWIHMYSRKIFAERKVKVQSTGIFMLAETLIRAKKEGCTFQEIFVKQTARTTGVATASKISTMLKTMKELLVFYFGDYRKN